MFCYLIRLFYWRNKHQRTTKTPINSRKKKKKNDKEIDHFNAYFVDFTPFIHLAAHKINIVLCALCSKPNWLEDKD